MVDKGGDNKAIRDFALGDDDPSVFAVEGTAGDARGRGGDFEGMHQSLLFQLFKTPVSSHHVVCPVLWQRHASDPIRTWSPPARIESSLVCHCFGSCQSYCHCNCISHPDLNSSLPKPWPKPCKLPTDTHKSSLQGTKHPSTIP